MGRDGLQCVDGRCGLVSTHAPAWGATSSASLSYSFHKVSTHAPAWGATRNKWLGQLGNVFQPTRPHGARLSTADTQSADSGVSTHAPAWGATLTSSKKFILYGVSTHAPAWGATVIMCLSLLSVQFQPTRPHGARQDDYQSIMRVIYVSTHAPAWGATPYTKRQGHE